MAEAYYKAKAEAEATRRILEAQSRASEARHQARGLPAISPRSTVYMSPPARNQHLGASALSIDTQRDHTPRQDERMYIPSRGAVRDEVHRQRVSNAPALPPPSERGRMISIDTALLSPQTRAKLLAATAGHAPPPAHPHPAQQIQPVQQGNYPSRYAAMAARELEQRRYTTAGLGPTRYPDRRPSNNQRAYAPYPQQAYGNPPGSAGFHRRTTLPAHSPGYDARRGSTTGAGSQYASAAYLDWKAEKDAAIAAAREVYIADLEREKAEHDAAERKNQAERVKQEIQKEREDPVEAKRRQRKIQFQVFVHARATRCKWRDCPATLNSWSNLEKHIQHAHISHAEDSQLVCLWSECNATFTEKDKLFRHCLVDHMGDFCARCPFKCRFEGPDFASLMAHIGRRHPKATPDDFTPAVASAAPPGVLTPPPLPAVAPFEPDERVKPSPSPDARTEKNVQRGCFSRSPSHQPLNGSKEKGWLDKRVAGVMIGEIVRMSAAQKQASAEVSGTTRQTNNEMQVKDERRSTPPEDYRPRSDVADTDTQSTLRDLPDFKSLARDVRKRLKAGLPPSRSTSPYSSPQAVQRPLPTENSTKKTNPSPKANLSRLGMNDTRYVSPSPDTQPNPLPSPLASRRSNTESTLRPEDVEKFKALFANVKHDRQQTTPSPLEAPAKQPPKFTPHPPNPRLISTPAIQGEACVSSPQSGPRKKITLKLNCAASRETSPVASKSDTSETLPEVNLFARNPSDDVDPHYSPRGVKRASSVDHGEESDSEGTIRRSRPKMSRRIRSESEEETIDEAPHPDNQAEDDKGDLQGTGGGHAASLYLADAQESISA